MRRGDAGALSRHEAELSRIGEPSREEAAEAAEEPRDCGEEPRANRGPNPICNPTLPLPLTLTLSRPQGEAGPDEGPLPYPYPYP